ncbi:hypothetical protein B0I35DRAFT_437269 [Stachybotrys elegans]|uniref:Chitin-binding type-2 domain-containing protein n=1 Tax=Stachybotrys elegans TaxID=80388 RepID=A0A8K0SR22_9HYPO|nr:hypothetical protein B0I35DRAFT_437269 [Stachybotrys elegans]
MHPYHLLATALGLARLSSARSSLGLTCGSNIPSCPLGFSCVPAASSCTNLATCPGRCVPTPFAMVVANEPGRTPKASTTCSTSPPSETAVPERNEYPFCGGFTPTPPPPCPAGTLCMADTRYIQWELIADLPGICVPNDVEACGGPNNLGCSRGYQCYEDPRSDCDPSMEGAMCHGICL